MGQPKRALSQTAMRPSKSTHALISPIHTYTTYWYKILSPRAVKEKRCTLKITSDDSELYDVSLYKLMMQLSDNHFDDNKK